MHQVPSRANLPHLNSNIITRLHHNHVLFFVVNDMFTGVDQRLKRKENKHKTQRRGRKRCPVDGCQVTVIHLPRHLRQVHEWGREEAQSAVNTFSLGAPSRHGDSSSKAKNNHHSRPCPMTGCHEVVKRLPAHLRKQHKLEKNSPLYRELLTASQKRRSNVNEWIVWCLLWIIILADVLKLNEKYVIELGHDWTRQYLGKQ